MKMKKFLKYLMGKGLPRNKAELFAKALNIHKIPYGSCRVGEVYKAPNGVHHGSCIIQNRNAYAISMRMGHIDKNAGTNDYNVLFRAEPPIVMSDLHQHGTAGQEWTRTDLSKWLRANPSLIPPGIEKRWMPLRKNVEEV